MVIAKFAALFALCSFAFCQEVTNDPFQRFRDQLQRDPGNALIHLSFGEALSQQHNYQAAANEFRAALNGDPHPLWVDKRAHVALGEIFELTNQHERADRENDLAARIADEPTEIKGIENYISTPQPLVKVQPRYSREAQIAELEGSVRIGATVTAGGSISHLRVEGPLGAGLDEEAQAAAERWTFRPGSAEDGPKDMATTFELNFLLPAKTSRWHLLRAVFDSPNGVSSPRFIKTIYPAGDGVSPAMADDARIVAAIGRQAVVLLRFDVDAAGRPSGFRVEQATGLGWGQEAIAFVRNWRFQPGDKNGVAVNVPCTIQLVWGEKKFSENSLARARSEFAPVTIPR
jgi:TonB family protein